MEEGEGREEGRDTRVFATVVKMTPKAPKGVRRPYAFSLKSLGVLRPLV